MLSLKNRPLTLPIFTPPGYNRVSRLTATDFNLEELRGLLKGSILLFCHHNADPDSICAAYAFQALSEALDSSVESDIVLPGGASSISRRIMEELGIVVAEDPHVEDADVLVVLDTATLRQLEEWGEVVAHADAPKVFIDHHSPHPETSSIASLYLVDEAASSTCEIVHQLYEGYRLTPSARVAKALLTGIAYDSKHFSIGTARTLRSVFQLLEIDGPLEAVIALLTPERDRSECIARLKAAQRMRLHEVGGWIVATSHLSSFQASAARALLGLGADVAIVAGRNKRKLRASLRANNRFHIETSIHLGRDIAMPIGEEFRGAGSGHPTAAGVNGEGNLRAMLMRFVELVSSKVNEK